MYTPTPTATTAAPTIINPPVAPTPHAVPTTVPT